MQSIEKFSISYEHGAALYDAKPAGDVFLFYSVLKKVKANFMTKKF